MSTIADLIRSGALIPVAVYGGCGHPEPLPGHPNRTCDEDEHFSWGLSDRFSRHSPGGSDCNRAEFFLLRPNDLGGHTGVVEDLAEIRAALNEVLDGNG